MAQLAIHPPLVRDFRTFLDYCVEHKPKVTKTSRHINRKDCFAINARMSEPQANAHERMDQAFYSLIHLFFELALAGRLLSYSDDGNRLQANREQLLLFDQLTDMEQYVYLVKTLWCYANWSTIQTADRPRNSQFDYIYMLETLSKTPKGQTADVNHGLGLIGWKVGYVLRYFEHFGWCNCTWRDVEGVSKREWLAETITLTALGNAWLHALEKRAPFEKYNMHSAFLLESRLTEPELSLEVALRELFAEPVRPLPTVSAVGKRPGVYEFTITPVYFPKVHRRLRISGKQSLEQLHLLIQEAFSFDDDHLYTFFLDGRRWSETAIKDPRDDFSEGPRAHEFAIEDIPWNPQQPVLYLFDYGDEWLFSVKFESVDTEADEPDVAKVVAKVGKAPKQYG